MKKLKYLIITCLSFAILSYGVIAFANGGTSTASKDLSHGDVSGKFIVLVEGKSKIKVNIGTGVETYPLDKSIWVFRDQKKTALENLKSGDKLELILNSSKKVTYIKAFSEVFLKAEVTIVSVSPTPTTTITAEPTPSATPEHSPSITSNENKQIIMVIEDNRVDIKKEEQKHSDAQDDDNDNFDNDDNNSNDDHHNDKNKHENEGEED
jgi:TusA-related sulfurtransferase